jgi:ribosome-binding factor A
MSVEVDGDLSRAIVYFDTLGGEDDDERVLEALDDQRTRLRGAVGRQARVKRTPERVFRPDDVGRSAARHEEVLRKIHDED